jgi:hypothetical protein
VVKLFDPHCLLDTLVTTLQYHYGAPNSHDQHFNIVHYPNPKFIKKAHMRNVQPFSWRDQDKRADLVAGIATCTRCAQNVVKQKKVCDKSEHRRCDHCTGGNRGGCTLVSATPVVITTQLI